MSEHTAYHGPVDLAEKRAAKVAKARPVGRRALTTDQAEEYLQAQLKSAEPPATAEERAMLIAALLGCAIAVAGFIGYVVWG